MHDANEDPLHRHGCRTVAQDAEWRVGMVREVHDVYIGFEAKVRDKLNRIMHRWCGGHAMTFEMFNGNEGRSPKGTALKAFKSFKHRLYGFETKIDGIKTFVIVDCDPAKKRDKADPKILSRAQSRVDDFGEGN